MGLANHGTTCYINCILQCLEALPGFSTCVNEALVHIKDKGSLSFAVVSGLCKVWASHSFEATKDFMHVVSKLSIDFKPGRQCDARQLLLRS